MSRRTQPMWRFTKTVGCLATAIGAGVFASITLQQWTGVSGKLVFVVGALCGATLDIFYVQPPGDRQSLPIRALQLGATGALAVWTYNSMAALLAGEL